MKRICISLILAAALLLSGCAIRSNLYIYSNSSKYSTLDKPVSGNVTKLDIDWIGGSVEIIKGDSFSVSEEADAGDYNDEYRLRYWMDGTTLRIKFAVSGANLSNIDLSKSLTVVIPSELSEIDIDAVSADIGITGVTSRDVDIDVVSGDIDSQNASFKYVSVHSVSGRADLSFAEEPPKSIDFDSVSGDLTLYLKDGVAFEAKMSSVSGDFNSDFNVNVQKNRYIYGEGRELEIDFDSVSGDLSVRKEK